MNGHFSPADWLVIVAYLGGIVALGVWFGRDQHSTRDYFLGSRNIPWWGIGLSIVAAETSALTIIGVPAIAYGSDILFIQMIAGYVIARLILAVVLVPHYLSGEIYSPYQLLEQHLGRGPRRLAGAFFLFLETLAAGGLFALLYIPTRVAGGWDAALAQAAAAGKLVWLNTRFTFSAPFNIWMGVIGGTVLVLSSHGAEQLIVQRVLACRNVADGRKALVLSAALIFPLFLIFLLVGVMLWVFYQSHPLQIPLPEARPGLKSNDFIFPIFMLTEVPPVLKGFLIVAILSAAMSSISSALTALASVSTMDFLQPLLPGRSEAWLLRFSRYSTVFWAGALVFVAWLTREAQFVLNAAFSLRGLTSGALLGGLLLALFGRRVGARAAMAGMVASLLVMNALYWPANIPATREWWLHTFGGEVFWPWFTLIGTGVTLGTAWLARALRPE